jgi:general secretion pathway protein G
VKHPSARADTKSITGTSSEIGLLAKAGISMKAVTNMYGRKRGFSLVELVIVIVIIGIIAAIAIPRVSRGARGAGESALRSDLATMRNAIELYASEHNGVYPGITANGTVGDATLFTDQLLKYTDTSGNAQDTKDATHPYGPYLRKQIPPLPVGSGTSRNSSTVKVADPLPTADGATDGWLYCPKTGEIIANSTDNDESGTKTYSTY